MGSEDQTDEERWARGKAGLDAVYGTGFSSRYPGRDEVTPFSLETVEHLFGEIWHRPGLSVRDRRLLVMGATSAIGVPDRIRVQALGALRNGELSAEELREAGLQLAYYAGWTLGSQLNEEITAAIAEFAAETAAAG